jgi:F-type H+-transporting ATPase subunit b
MMRGPTDASNRTACHHLCQPGLLAAGVFGLIFFVIGRGMVPKVMATVDQRDKQIADDLSAAEAARAAADAEEEAWRVQENKRRAEAQALIAAAKAEAASTTQASLDVASGKIEQTVSAAEARIATARDAALTEIEGVAASAAQDIVSRLAAFRFRPNRRRAR